MQPPKDPFQDASVFRAEHSKPAGIARRDLKNLQNLIALGSQHSITATRAQAERMRLRLRAVAAETVLSKNPRPREFFEVKPQDQHSPLGSDDPRWILARETARAMGGAVLPFERREGLMALAQRLGLRPFDANLIVAVVQDRARRGESIESATPSLMMIAGAPPKTESFARVMAVAIVLAIVADAWLVGWLLFS